MIFNLKNFNDTGKCSMGTCLDSFNTEKDHIFICIKEIKDIKHFNDYFAEVKINNINDLFNWLWNIPSVSTGSKDNGHNYWFYQNQDWWIRYYNQNVDNNKKAINKITKKLNKEKDPEKCKQYQKELEFYSLKSCDSMLKFHNDMKEKNMKELINDNK